MQLAALILAIASAPASAAVVTPASAPGVGEAFQIDTDRQMEERGNRDDSPRSTSTDRDSFVERVVTVRPNGVVIEYDLPPSASAADRASSWQFPFQVIKARDGTFQLLNAPELSGRVDRWLKAAGMPHTACGKLIFTWNAFRIECDPQYTLRWLATVIPPDNLKVGSPLTDPDAGAFVTLRQGGANKLLATLQVDPATIRRERAETDVGLAQLTHKALTLEAALKAHEAETVTGTIAVTFDLDPAGRTRRRTRVRTVQIAWASGRIATQIITETLTRTPLSMVPKR